MQEQSDTLPHVKPFVENPQPKKVPPFVEKPDPDYKVDPSSLPQTDKPPGFPQEKPIAPLKKTPVQETQAEPTLTEEEKDLKKLKEDIRNRRERSYRKDSFS